MSTTDPGSRPTPAATWVSPAQRDAARAASICQLLPTVPGVAAVHRPTGAGSVGSQLGGIQISEERVEVHIVAEYGIPLQRTADNIDTAVGFLLNGRALQVMVDDILLPGEQLSATGKPAPSEKPPGRAGG